MSRVATIFGLLLAICFPYPLSGAPGDRGTLTLAAGQSGGTYYSIGNAITRKCSARNLSVELIASAGSVENVRLLESGKADFALVQSDIARRALRGHLPFNDPIKVVLVTPLFTEAVQILVRSDLYIFNVGELRGKLVSIGPEGSGTEVTARSVLEASGLGTEEIRPRHLPMASTYSELRDEQIDAAFVASSVPTAIVQRALADNEARLLLLEPNLIDRLAATGSYIKTYIPRHSYPNQPDEIETVGVQAFLLAREDVPPESVTAVLQILGLERSAIEAEGRVRLDLLGTLTSVAIPAHQSSLRFLSKPAHPVMILVLIGFAASLLVIATYTKRRHIRRSLSGHEEIILGIVVLVGLWFSSAGALYYYEHNINESFSSYSGSLWSVLVYISGGFQKRSPVTRSGEAVSVIAIIIGVGVIAWFTGTLAGHFVTAKLKTLENLLLGRNLVPSSLKDHIVIVNWDDRAESIVEQLHGPDIDHKRTIVVLSEEPVRFPHRGAFESCLYINMDASSVESLEHARVHEAHSFTILSSWRIADASDRRKNLDPNVADAKTVVTILSCRRMCTAKGNKQVAITAEIKSLRNVAAARYAGEGGPTEIVCVEKFGMNLLAQCCLTPGLVALYEDLLTFEPDTDEVYKIELPQECVSKSFAQVLVHFADRRQSKQSAVLPIGVYRHGVTYLNPEVGKVDPLMRGDYLFVISDTDESYLVESSR